ncbi:MAG: SLBB domain-containing protein [Candidatus Latescibacter sp.]|nr:SLBB domain-containing protein [Candidatus Latescibacter sp.]
MSFSIKRFLVFLLVMMCVFINAPFSPCQSFDQMIDYSNLPGLRTMANQPVNPQAGMEVGDVNVPSIIPEEKKEQLLPGEQPAPEALPVFFDMNKIDPDKYIIGADDLLNLYLWGELDMQFRLTVSPEGTVNIRTVGSVEVADHTLAESKELIKKFVSKKYSGIDISVTLVRPRYFRLYVSGVVSRAGAVVSHPIQRVSDVVERAGLNIMEIQNVVLTRQQEQEYEPSLRRESSQRSIVVHRGDKDIPVDLQRFRKFGDLEANPYVSAGDRIEVPPYIGSTFIYGNVNNPGRYEFKPGDRVLDLVKFGSGITSVADTARATLVRFDGKGKDLINIDINLYDALYLNPDDPKYLIHESDRLSVWKKFDYKTIADVILGGEVRYPGVYPITENQTTLTDIITMAGGFTVNANLDEARIIRRSSTTAQDLEYQRLRTMAVADMTPQEYDFFKSLSRSRPGEISIDFVKLFTGNDLSNDIFLVNRDVITIPANRDLVRVTGAVQQPGYIKWEQKSDVNFYIGKAGGYNFNADISKSRIIKAKTGQYFKLSKNIPLEAGDTIHVPETKPFATWNAVKDAATFLANAATIVILAKQLKNF